jgi:hypothetical protein
MWIREARANSPHQEEGPVDIIIGGDNPKWLPFPVREAPHKLFTLMWKSLCQCYILR